jgi:hypothetical protein
MRSHFAFSPSGPALYISLQTLQILSFDGKEQKYVSRANFVHALCVKLHWDLLCKNTALPVLLLVFFVSSISTMERNSLPDPRASIANGMHRIGIFDLSGHTHFIFDATDCAFTYSVTLCSGN